MTTPARVPAGTSAIGSSDTLCTPPPPTCGQSAPRQKFEASQTTLRQPLSGRHSRAESQREPGPQRGGNSLVPHTTGVPVRTQLASRATQAPVRKSQTLGAAQGTARSERQSSTQAWSRQICPGPQPPQGTAGGAGLGREKTSAADPGREPAASPTAASAIAVVTSLGALQPVSGAARAAAISPTDQTPPTRVPAGAARRAAGSSPGRVRPRQHGPVYIPTRGPWTSVPPDALTQPAGQAAPGSSRPSASGSTSASRSAIDGTTMDGW